VYYVAGLRHIQIGSGLFLGAAGFIAAPVIVV
jgi:hypothetical protein